MKPYHLLPTVSTLIFATAMPPSAHGASEPVAKNQNSVHASSVGGSSYPGTLSEPLKSYTLQIMPDGSTVISGTTNGTATGSRSYLWKPNAREWERCERPGGRGSDPSVSPLNENHLLSGYSLSKDGGKTWKEVVKQMNLIEGNQVQIAETFWPIKKADTILLSQVILDAEAGIFEMDLGTGKISPWSKTKEYLMRYERVGDKHFGGLGFWDAEASIKCVVSEDDAKTWKPVAVEQTPWALHAAAQIQVKKLVPLSDAVYGTSPIKPQPTVSWVVELGDVAFCRFEIQCGPKLVPAQRTLFSSSDHGRTWVPAVLDKRTADVHTLFAQSPFVSKDPEGNLNINPQKFLRLKFNNKTQQIFSNLNGEWFVTMPTDLVWHPINTLPKLP